MDLEKPLDTPRMCAEILLQLRKETVSQGGEVCPTLVPRAHDGRKEGGGSSCGWSDRSSHPSGSGSFHLHGGGCSSGWLRRGSGPDQARLCLILHHGGVVPILTSWGVGGRPRHSATTWAPLYRNPLMALVGTEAHAGRLLRCSTTGARYRYCLGALFP